MFSARTGCSVLAIAACAASLAASASAWADQDIETCRRAYEQAQLNRRDEKLLAAREQLRICGGDSCPAVARADCVEWLGQVQGAIPSVVPEARGPSGPLFDASV